MKVCVYAICKNESQFVDRWMDSMEEADLVVVLDTGSTDDTVEKLRKRGAVVQVETITPWRFDVARNRSLELIPEDVDVCVCTDLDEVFHKGWRKALESVWSDNVGQVSYRYTWSFQPNGAEGVVFWQEKIHRRFGYRWTHPVHEVLTWVGEGIRKKTVPAYGIQLDHYPDHSKSRGQYLPLLEMSVEEDPTDDRNMHYLGREYMYKGEWLKAINTLKKHLNMEKATWSNERCASMRYIARSYIALGNHKQAEIWFLQAIAEAPHLREPWLDFAELAYANKDWFLLIWLTERSLTIQQRPATYISEAASWGSLPYDLCALGYYYIGNFMKSLSYVEKALSISPDDARLQNNRKLIQEKIQVN
ncbi:MAG: glycosyl transferase family 2 [Ruminococcaceae bacterium]|nr:glycosyl transferase family 2 [Oscillospiraceae bacterium]